jgi:TolB protein
LITASSQGGNEFLITNFLEDELPSWSPDGRTILFFSRRSGDRRAVLYVTNADAEFRNNPARQLNLEGEAPWWGASGQIVFKGWGSTAPGLRLTTGEFTAAQTVTANGGAYAPALSPNGRQIAYMARDDTGNWDIYRVNADGTGQVRLTTNAARDGLPAWSPNGRAIAFVTNRGGQWAIYGINADGSVEQKLLDMAGSPDGIVFFDQANSTGWLEERISWRQ